MSFEFRRVITGHDKSGLAVIKEDAVVASSARSSNYEAATVWCTAQFPVNNDEDAYTHGEPGPKGSRVLMRIGEMRPGDVVARPMHRTETLDFAIVLSGSCDMALDGGEVVRRLSPGDVVIQRGTNHAWVLNGESPVRFLFVLIDAHPVHCGDKILGDFLDNFGGTQTPMPQQS